MPELDMARELLGLAEDDARAVHLMLKSGQFPHRIRGFHAQQAVEKALKAWLVLKEADYPPTHSIYTLLALLRGAGEDCARYSVLEGLSPYAVQLRYESAGMGGAQLDPAVVMPVVVELLEHVRQLLEAAQAAELDRD